MPTNIAIGFSQATSPQEAAFQACVSAKNQLNSIHTDLVLLFVSPTYAGAEVLESIHKILQPKRLIGLSTAGIILNQGSFSRGIAILALNSDEISFGIAAIQPSQNKDMRTAGFDLGRKLNADFKGSQRQACLLFTDPLFQNNTDFIKGTQEVLGLGFPLLGAVNSGDVKSRKEVQFYQRQSFSQGALGLLLGGANVGTGYQHGFKPLGKPRRITKASNNIIHTIDDKPAFHIYEEFLGSEAEKLKKSISSSHSLLYPLGLYMEDHGQYLLKNAVDILIDGSIVCQGEAIEGAEVHLMIGSRDSCIKSAVKAAHQVKEKLGMEAAKLIIIIESAARPNILRRNASAEIQAILDILGNKTPLIGMYGFGEISPLGLGHGINSTFVQNESILILGLN